MGFPLEWLVKFIEHKIADRRVVRLIQKWLNAGVLEDGKRMRVGRQCLAAPGQRLSSLRVRHYVFDMGCLDHHNVAAPDAK